MYLDSVGPSGWSGLMFGSTSWSSTSDPKAYLPPFTSLLSLYWVTDFNGSPGISSLPRCSLNSSSRPAQSKNVQSQMFWGLAIEPTPCEVGIEQFDLDSLEGNCVNF
mmetsp:Transcript_3099/g.6556  ORF Transcript_3099/g.6556 Transcript_3099/m.6556 type:complete len:107 (+) Transcript_3099:3084-3404(+)